MRLPRFPTVAALALLSAGWAATESQAGPLRYRGPRDRWHGGYYAAPAYGGYYSPGYSASPVYGAAYSSYPVPAYPVVTPSYYSAPSLYPGVYPAGGLYYGSGYGGDYVPHHHHYHH